MWHKWHSTQFKIQTVALSGPGIWSSYASEWNTHQSKGQHGASTRSFPRLALSQHAPWEWLMRNNIQTHSSSTQAKCKMNAAKWKKTLPWMTGETEEGHSAPGAFFKPVAMLLYWAVNSENWLLYVINSSEIRSIQLRLVFRMKIL